MSRLPLVLLLATLVIVAVLGVIGLGVERDLQPTSLAIPGTSSSRGETLARENFGESVPFAVLLRGPAAAIDRQGPRLVAALRRDRAATTISPWEHAAPAALRPGPDRALILVDYHLPLATAIRDTVPALERTLAARIHRPVTATQSGFATISRALQRGIAERLRARRAARRSAADHRPAPGLSLPGRGGDTASPRCDDRSRRPRHPRPAQLLHADRRALPRRLHDDGPGARRRLLPPHRFPLPRGARRRHGPRLRQRFAPAAPPGAPSSSPGPPSSSRSLPPPFSSPAPCSFRSPPLWSSSPRSASRSPGVPCPACLPLLGPRINAGRIGRRSPPLEARRRRGPPPRPPPSCAAPPSPRRRSRSRWPSSPHRRSPSTPAPRESTSSPLRAPPAATPKRSPTPSAPAGRRPSSSVAAAPRGPITTAHRLALLSHWQRRIAAEPGVRTVIGLAPLARAAHTLRGFAGLDSNGQSGVPAAGAARPWPASRRDCGRAPPNWALPGQRRQRTAGRGLGPRPAGRRRCSPPGSAAPRREENVQVQRSAGPPPVPASSPPASARQPAWPSA